MKIDPRKPPKRPVKPRNMILCEKHGIQKSWGFKEAGHSPDPDINVSGLCFKCIRESLEANFGKPRFDG